MLIWISGITGAAIGSFIALAISRYSPEKTPVVWGKSLIIPRSYCHHCHHVLALTDLLPLLSWLSLRGRCRYCQHKIGLAPVVTEVFCAGLMTILCQVPALPARTGLLIFTTFLILLAEIDRRWQLLPDTLTLPLIWLGLLFNTFDVIVPCQEAVIGTSAGYLILRLFGFLYHSVRKTPGLGRGDVKLFAALGAWGGWQVLPLIATLSSLLALIFVLIYQWPIRCRLPFGPFLAAAGWLVIITQPNTLNLIF